MIEMKDIESLEDIKIFVDAFYTKIREDELLAPIFGMRIENDNWEKHLNRMYNFWNTVLFPARTYKGNPFSKHMTLPIDKTHFSQWLNLFNQTIDEHFKGDMAEEAKNRAMKMAYLFQSKLEYLANNPQMKPLV